MRANCNLTIGSSSLLLVPYRKEHVPIYHGWMQDEELLEATASEPLSLQDEYAMQKSWLEDENKCTFIILDKSLPSEQGLPENGAAMAGDVNLFFNDPDDSKIAEIEIMIAEKRSRRKGLARQALQMMMQYAIRELKCTKFVAKIGDTNQASLSLFENLGFHQVKHSKVFQEVHKELLVTKELETSLASSLQEEPEYLRYET